MGRTFVSNKKGGRECGRVRQSSAELLLECQKGGRTPRGRPDALSDHYTFRLWGSQPLERVLCPIVCPRSKAIEASSDL